MENSEAKERLLRKTYSQILVGFSITKYRNKDIFIKHSTPLDNLEIDYLYTQYYKEAVERGYPTEEDRINDLKKDGLWEDNTNEEIDAFQNAIKNLLILKRKAFRLADIELVNKQIKEQEENLNNKITKKENLIGSTAEKFTGRKVDSFFMSQSFYMDKELTKLLFSEEEFDNLDSNELNELYEIYQSSLRDFSEINIKKISLSDFFLNVFHLAENIYQFFGKPLCNLTFYQVQLCAYGNFFRNILSGEMKPPEHIKSNPEKLEDWYFSRGNAEEELKRLRKDGNEDSSLVGLTKEDREFLGLPAPAKLSMKEKIEKAGGELSFDQIMKIEGE